jgi:hypothetical protein
MGDGSDATFMEGLCRRGDRRLLRVNFRRHYATIWSLDSGDTVLNLQGVCCGAPASIRDAFAVIARGADKDMAAYREAARHMHQWPVPEPALRSARIAHQRLKR